MAVCLALAISPVVVSLEGDAVAGADSTVTLVQSRVAVARFERDLRLAGAGGCPFAVSGPVLEASPSQVVFLARVEDGTEPIIVEWEISRGSLMRRWGPCPAVRPGVYAHSLYTDNKTMLDGLRAGSAFAYVGDGVVLTPPTPEGELVWVEAVILSAEAGDEGARGPVGVSTRARVGR